MGIETTAARLIEDLEKHQINPDTRLKILIEDKKKGNAIAFYEHIKI